MKRIRSKLILALVVITLLPVFPLYYLVRNLLQQSIEVGYNENVEAALDAASGLSRELFAKYKQDVLQQAGRLATADWVRQTFLQQALATPDTTALEGGRIAFYDAKAKLIFSVAAGSAAGFPDLYQTDVQPLAKASAPQILKVRGDLDFIAAAAPVFSAGQRLGFIVFAQPVAERFRRMSRQIVRVNQMFKTLDFFESDLKSGFILSFFAVYVPIALLSVLLGIYFSRKFTRPLLALVEGTRRVSAGDWEYRIPVTTRDEIADVSVAFNRMIATLKDKQDQVIELEKMAAWREIARVLAHEIKNPLTPIQLTVQQLKDKYSGDDAAYRKLLAECTAIIEDEIANLRTLVREFSDFARMPELSLESGDLNDLLRDLGKLYSDVHFELCSAPLLCSFDYEKMRRVLINLVENGRDSIREKGAGEITLKTSQTEDRVEIVYSDTGTGISPEVQQKIFEPYFSTKKSGMGLGLAIVKKIIAEHGGNILLDSTPGVGTTFTITLPKGREES